MIFFFISRFISRTLYLSNHTASYFTEWTLHIIGEQAALLQSIQWLDNNSASLITDSASQRIARTWFTHEESETMALQILEWISISKLVAETVWTVALEGALITVQWLHSESLTQFRFLIKKQPCSVKRLLLNFGKRGVATENKLMILHKYMEGDTAQSHLESNSPFQDVASGWHPHSP